MDLFFGTIFVVFGTVFLIYRSEMRLRTRLETQQGARRSASQFPTPPIDVHNLSVRMNASKPEMRRPTLPPTELAEHAARIAEARARISDLPFFHSDSEPHGAD